MDTTGAYQLPEPAIPGTTEVVPGSIVGTLGVDVGDGNVAIRHWAWEPGPRISKLDMVEAAAITTVRQLAEAGYDPTQLGEWAYNEAPIGLTP